MTAAFTLTAVTNDADLGARCAAAGVDRIGVDIERLGKRERQGHLPHARISDHTLEDLTRLRQAAPDALLFARLNPWHAGAPAEVEEALAHGAGVLMLPYFADAQAVARFAREVRGRALTAALVETCGAVEAIEDVVATPGLDEVLVGLNDLGLSFGLTAPFALFRLAVVERIAEATHARGLPFGFGGVGRAGDENSPIPVDLVLAQHARLGSRAAWLARSFFAHPAVTADLAGEVAALRTRLAYWAQQPVQVLADRRGALLARLAELEAQG